MPIVFTTAAIYSHSHNAPVVAINIDSPSLAITFLWGLLMNSHTYMVTLTGIIREGRGVGFPGVATVMVSALSGDPERECVPFR